MAYTVSWYRYLLMLFFGVFSNSLSRRTIAEILQKAGIIVFSSFRFCSMMFQVPQTVRLSAQRCTR